MTRTRLLLAGLIAGTMAVGTACKTDSAQHMPNTPPTAPSTPDDAGVGGSGVGFQDPRDSEAMGRDSLDNPLPSTPPIDSTVRGDDVQGHITPPSR